ncbi:MAG: DUF58 domain-containing protein [Acidimicrobiales bacterium]
MSPTGRTVALVALAGASALWLSAEVAAVLVVAVLVAFLVDAWSVRRPPQVERTVPAEVVRGRPVPIVVAVVAAPSAARRVEVRQPQTEDLRVEPAEAVGDLAGSLVAGRRGRHELPPPTTRSPGRLGLGRWVHRGAEVAVVASHADLPGGRRIAHAVQTGRFREEGLRRGALGLGTDFESVRDYAPDDDIRRMNWKATERAGRPMVNQYREDSERQLWCLIDVGRLLASPVGDRTRLDVALDAVAAVAATADALGDRVGAVAYDDQVRRVVEPRRHAAADLVRGLDDLEPTLADTDHEAAFARVGSAKRALVVVFTDLLDAAAARPLVAAAPVLARRHAVVVAGVNDPDLVRAVATPPAALRDLHRAAVAQDILDEREAVAARLVAAGAQVVDAPAARFPSACVAAYLRLKASAACERLGPGPADGGHALPEHHRPVEPAEGEPDGRAAGVLRPRGVTKPSTIPHGTSSAAHPRATSTPARPSARSASARVRWPGCTMAHPTRSPAAPATVMSDSSSTPWGATRRSTLPPAPRWTA